LPEGKVIDPALATFQGFGRQFVGGRCRWKTFQEGPHLSIYTGKLYNLPGEKGQFPDL
jgi:hypothetical protein